MKPDIKLCAFDRCTRVGVITCNISDTVSVYTEKRPEFLISKMFCCKTHMLRFLQKQKVPRYSKKRVQRLAGTEPLPLKKKSSD